MARNRFTRRFANTKESTDLDMDAVLLRIMQREFPDDPVYAAGRLKLDEAKSKPEAFNKTDTKPLPMADRVDNRLFFVDGKEEYAEYTLDKSYPTINDQALDNLLDDEWSFFVDPPPPPPPAPKPTGLFLINKEIQLNPGDFHDAYLRFGPTTIANRLKINNPVTVIRQTFCVFYIDNGKALPIPNYQTLEVMLVEAGKSYVDIKEATPEQIREFDLLIDGVFEGDPTITSKPDILEEYEFRKMRDRSAEWNHRVRFDSGYKPKPPFIRDPGDYIKLRGYTGTTGVSKLQRVVKSELLDAQRKAANFNRSAPKTRKDDI
jgi:hypothetical protein